ncbi:hypothetical protein M0813_27818 [Anaeramoeba flamelloides]|uniref:Ubiquitin-activating enzyme E1 C-terminal domain-containing protein n=1 Tax=Anaeramoeba flamelloides TaxID=1746091 RepID=A0ABQ8XV53_9EUKA|nr:hypothetical protein M0813_27818 [Anaeramoeba flamelloides]
MSKEMEIEIEKETKVDEDLYSRQIYALGEEAMKKLTQTNVLVLGLSGLGIEISKNIVLAGVKSVTIWDDQCVKISDLSSHFYFKETDVGKNRAKVSLPQLKELNEYVNIHLVDNSSFDEDFLKNYTVVVCVNQTDFEKVLGISDICHSLGIKFIQTDTRGLFGQVFCDFGKSFLITDPNGEPCLTTMITSITKANPGVVTNNMESRHGFEDGDWVEFSELAGMTELNGKRRQIKYMNPFEFSIGDTTDLSEYKFEGSGGYATQVKVPIESSHLSLRESLENPEFNITDYSNFDLGKQLFYTYLGWYEYLKSNKFQIPKPHQEEVFQEILSNAKKANDKRKEQYEEAIKGIEDEKEKNKVPKQFLEEIPEELVKSFAYMGYGELSPMTAFFGGVVGQEILKACTSKFTPLKQWLLLDFLKALPKDYDKINKEEFELQNSRYDPYIAVFGKTIQKKIQDINYFLVGAGAIGCEMLKNWAMMGLGTGENGKIHVTDMDTIEKSNLNRQFLFRNSDINELKDATACKSVKKMNPDLNIIPYSIRVGKETENVFNPDFYENLDGVCNALDNVEARLYIDSNCVFYKKSLLESGTLGPKGNTQVIVPYLTECYADSRDPPEKGIPQCTLHNFPNKIDHTIQWARDKFEGLFTTQPLDVNNYLKHDDYIQELEKKNLGVMLQTLRSVYSDLSTKMAKDFQDCVNWAVELFTDLFRNQIAQLLFSYPLNAKNKRGEPFWTGKKRPPVVIEFDPENDLHLDFVVAASNLRARIYSIDKCLDHNKIKEMSAKYMIPEFVPAKGVKIQVDENETNNDDDDDDFIEQDEIEINDLKKQLPNPKDSEVSAINLKPEKFEKDDDSNFHIDFITACSNLRASNYKIPLANRLKTKGIAGKIIPALATTTAAVTGLVCLELYKLILEKDIECYTNSFLNLSLPYFGFSEPIKCKTTKYVPTEEKTFSIWDRIDINGSIDTTVNDLKKWFTDNYKYETVMITCLNKLIYNSYGQTAEEDSAKTVIKLIEECGGKVSPDQRYIPMIFMCEDENEEDVELPTVCFKINK